MFSWLESEQEKGRGTSADVSVFQPLVQGVPGPAHLLGGVLSQGPPRRGTGVRKAMTGQPRVNDIGQVVMALHGCVIRLGRHP